MSDTAVVVLTIILVWAVACVGLGIIVGRRLKKNRRGMFDE